jgi:hypothetical protein
MRPAGQRMFDLPDPARKRKDAREDLQQLRQWAAFAAVNLKRDYRVPQFTSPDVYQREHEYVWVGVGNGTGLHPLRRVGRWKLGVWCFGFALRHGILCMGLFPRAGLGRAGSGCRRGRGRGRGRGLGWEGVGVGVMRKSTPKHNMSVQVSLTRVHGRERGMLACSGLVREWGK